MAFSKFPSLFQNEILNQACPLIREAQKYLGHFWRQTNPVGHTQRRRPLHALSPRQISGTVFWAQVRVRTVPSCGTRASCPRDRQPGLLRPWFLCPFQPSPQRSKSFCFVLHLQGVELVCSMHYFTLENINGKAPVLGTCVGTDTGVSFMGQSPMDQKNRSGQKEATLICLLCQWDLHNVSAWLLPC